ncbi:hypothetical protein GQ457_08G027190 [Hibiscus cannabinus]
MPCGECTITLEDVTFQLGVPILGPPIIAQNKEAVEITCSWYLGEVPNKTDIDGKRVKLTWLKSAFELDGNSSDKDVKCAARAFNFVAYRGWRSTILGFLYREMCKASKISNVDGRDLNADIGGCMVLLQSWAWYRMPFLAPICAAPSEFLLATRGPSGSGSSSSAVGGSSRRRGSGAGGRGRRARRAATEPEPEYAPQMEEANVQFVTGSYPRTQGEPSWEAAIEHTVVGHGTSGQVWRGQQPWSCVGVMGTTSLSSPLVSTGVGGAGPSMFRTPRQMNVESEKDSDDEDSGQVRGGVADDDGERGAEARVRNPTRRYDNTGSSHRQTLTRRRRGLRN